MLHAEAGRGVGLRRAPAHRSRRGRCRGGRTTSSLWCSWFVVVRSPRRCVQRYSCTVTLREAQRDERTVIDYEPLHQFVELTRTLHFGRAARACHVSPSALSRSVQRLEAELGEQLFEREHHKVTLTASGEHFRRHALAVLDEWHRYEQERAERLGELTGTLHMYCTVTAAQSIVPDLLGRLRRAHPGIRLELQTGYATDAIEQLRGGDIDASIAALPGRLPAGVV